jgi:ubiquinone/menaquinone biosynthesis C-methylase UbiE
MRVENRNVRDDIPALSRCVLACPRCRHAALDFTPEGIVCRDCGWRGTLRNGVFAALDADAPARFDTLHEVIEAQNAHPVVWRWLYDAQCRVLAEALRPGRVLLDIGCGPAAPYAKPAGALVVGADRSLASLDANRDIDLGLHASAAALPLADRSIDVAAAIYVFHHMVGATVAETLHNVEAAFAELSRVIKPGGEVLIFEICPWRATWLAERLGWATARRTIGRFIDFLFLPQPTYEALGRRFFPGATLDRRVYDIEGGAWFPPVLGLPWLKWPRFAYPFDVCLFRWQFPAA